MSLKNPLKYNQLLREIILTSSEENTAEPINLDDIDLILRNSLPLESMREVGSFFTGENLATKTLESFSKPINEESVILDPACGAGNLLVACSRKLSIYPTLSATLKSWGEKLKGYDLYDIFVESAKLRLIIEALNRGVKKDCEIHQAFELLPNIIKMDALDVTELDLSDVSHLIINPPFTITASPSKNYWKKGKINSAGLFLDYYIRLLPANCYISAILPDVLRSGSRYTDFRNFCEKNLKAQCHIWGRFNKKTDVDVFVLSGSIHRNSEKNINWFPDLGNYNKLSSKYDVRVGPLVAYRDEIKGPEYPYFHPKNSPAWEMIINATELRRFNGLSLTPPFVVVKRTSSPSDKFRATATIINLDKPVVIENHLIIIKPKDLTLESCKKLMKTLKSEKTNNFLNERIRTRHLTVEVIKDIPI